MKKMKKFVALLLVVVMAISMNITVFAETVVDWSACPNCGYQEALLYDSGKMYCPACGFKDSTWNCGYLSSLRVTISNKDIRHVLSHHTISSIVSQMPYITEKELQDKLRKTFFNPNWSDSRVIDSVNYAYNEVIRKNDDPHGEYTVTYFSEPVTVAFDHGQFKSGWGRYRYTLEKFLEQYGGM